jgi:hypothetical protein
MTTTSTTSDTYAEVTRLATLAIEFGDRALAAAERGNDALAQMWEEACESAHARAEALQA